MKNEKRIARLLSCPADFTFAEATSLLEGFGFKKYNKGSTSGSRVMFYRREDGRKILLHKPHPGDIMSQAAVRDVIRVLKESGDIDE